MATRTRKKKAPARKDYGLSNWTPGPMKDFAWHATGLPNIMAGRQMLYAKDADKLFSETGVHAVIDLREPHEWTAPKLGQAALNRLMELGVTRLSLPVRDMTAPPKKVLEDAVKFMQEAVKRNLRLFVHCRAGVERTGAVLLAYAASLDGDPTSLGLAQANTALKKDYPLYKPLESQLLSVIDFLGLRGYALPCEWCKDIHTVTPSIGRFTCRKCYSQPSKWEARDWKREDSGRRDAPRHYTTSELGSTSAKFDYADHPGMTFQQWKALQELDSEVERMDELITELDDSYRRLGYTLCPACGLCLDVDGVCEECGYGSAVRRF